MNEVRRLEGEDKGKNLKQPGQPTRQQNEQQQTTTKEKGVHSKIKTSLKPNHNRKSSKQ